MSTETTRRICIPYAGLHREPSTQAPLETQALFGETVRVLEECGYWCRVITDLDDYPGYLLRSSLSPMDGYAPTHRVAKLQAAVYPRPDFKFPISTTLYLNSRVVMCGVVETPEGYMCEIEDMGWVFEHCLRPIEYRAPNLIPELLRLGNQSIGVSYAWGWRSKFFDCSSAVQSACIAMGIPCPRDVIPQSQALGVQIIGAEDCRNLRPGDLVYWTQKKGRHVAVTVNSRLCFNVTIAAPYGRAVVMPLSTLINDQRRDGNGTPTTVRRLMF